MFQNIVSVDKEEHVITISENLNAVLDDVGHCFGYWPFDDSSRRFSEVSHAMFLCPNDGML